MSKRTAEQGSSEAGNKRRPAQSNEVDLTGGGHAEESGDLASKMRRCLKETFGFEAFRGSQEEAVSAALQGKDALVVMPTGGGKSMCYVLPALVQQKLVLVVSPLIALMQDQVGNLAEKGVAAAYLSSTQSEAEKSHVMQQLMSEDERLRLLYVTPELIKTDRWAVREYVNTLDTCPTTLDWVQSCRL
eukprot:gene15708-21818_t